MVSSLRVLARDLLAPNNSTKTSRFIFQRLAQLFSTPTVEALANDLSNDASDFFFGRESKPFLGEATGCNDEVQAPEKLAVQSLPGQSEAPRQERR